MTDDLARQCDANMRIFSSPPGLSTLGRRIPAIRLRHLMTRHEGRVADFECPLSRLHLLHAPLSPKPPPASLSLMPPDCLFALRFDGGWLPIAGREGDKAQERDFYMAMTTVPRDFMRSPTTISPCW